MIINITIKDKKIILAPWKGYGEGNYEWNYYRQSSETQIGFICNSARSYVKDPNLCYWKIDYNLFSCLREIASLYEEIYGKAHISFKDLPKAKENLDNLLLKFDTLKVFI